MLSPLPLIEITGNGNGKRHGGIPDRERYKGSARSDPIMKPLWCTSFRPAVPVQAKTHRLSWQTRHQIPRALSLEANCELWRQNLKPNKSRQAIPVGAGPCTFPTVECREVWRLHRGDACSMTFGTKETRYSKTMKHIQAVLCSSLLVALCGQLSAQSIDLTTGIWKVSGQHRSTGVLWDGSELVFTSATPTTEGYDLKAILTGITKEIIADVNSFPEP